jgi:hypothetical protein
VKAFNTTFAGTLSEGEVAGQPLDVFVAGDNEEAKSTSFLFWASVASARVGVSSPHRGPSPRTLRSDVTRSEGDGKNEASLTMLAQASAAAAGERSSSCCTARPARFGAPPPGPAAPQDK